jgi:hypothetical protein
MISIDTATRKWRRRHRGSSDADCPKNGVLSVENRDVVDLVGVDRFSGRVILTIADHLQWDSDEHLVTLQDKLNTYLRFIESGELATRYPDAKDRQPQITVVFKHPPDEPAMKFLESVSEVIKSAGIDFRYETMTH